MRKAAQGSNRMKGNVFPSETIGISSMTVNKVAANELKALSIFPCLEPAEIERTKER